MARIRPGRLLCLAAFLSVASSAPGRAAEIPPTATRALTVDAYPRVDGSTSAQPLGALLACRMTGASFAWQAMPFDGTRRLMPTRRPYDPAVRLALAFDKKAFIEPDNLHIELAKRIHHNGTHESYVKLISGEADLVLAARSPSDDERALAREKKTRIHTTPVALDAFIFIVNRENPTPSLTVDRIRDIYAGKIADWSQVGGPPGRINAYRRNRNSGSQETMERLVMKGLEMKTTADLETPISMIGPFNALRRDKRGLGYTFRYYDTHMTSIPETRAIAVDGVAPTAENIRARRYAFVTEVYAAWLNELPEDAPVRAVRDFLLSPAGQRVVEESGYVPIGGHENGSEDER